MSTRSVIVDIRQPATAIYVQCDGRSVGSQLRRIIEQHGRDDALRMICDKGCWYCIDGTVPLATLEKWTCGSEVLEPVVGYGVAVPDDGPLETGWRGTPWCEYETAVLDDGHVVTRTWNGWRKVFDSRIPADGVPASYITRAYANTTLPVAERPDYYLAEFYGIQK